MEGKTKENRRVCVTGAGGFAGSWLVSLLLSRRFTVHGTVRDPDDERNAHLKKLPHAAEHLKLFKADLLDYDSIAAAVAGCHGVFHVASPVPAIKVPNPETDVLAPAVDGSRNVLKAAHGAKVGRIIVVSSTAAVVLNPNWPKDKIKDEECFSDAKYCRETENWYFLSKTLAELEALDFAENTGCDIITICPSTIIGPMLQTTVNASSEILLNIMNGVRESVENRVWNFVDVRDLAEAMLLLYESQVASGRYICTSHTITSKELSEMLRSMFPNHKYPKNFLEVDLPIPYTSSKLQGLGWKFRPLEETLRDSVGSYRDACLLDAE